MTTLSRLADLPSFAARHPLLTHRPPPPVSLSPKPTKLSSSPPHRFFKLRCSVAKQSTVIPLGPAADGSTSSVDCVVVGGGISGLCIAQALVTKHNDAVPNVIVTEARDRVGGNIITVEKDGYLWEEGPNSFQPSDSMLTMLVDSGLKDDLVLGDPNAPRFVLWDGKLRPVPSSPADIAFFDLMSIGGKIRAAFGALGIRPAPPPPVCPLSLPLLVVMLLQFLDCISHFA